MGEQEVIGSGQIGPHTRSTLIRDLLALGMVPGSTVLVHSSLSSLGWVCGGAVTVIQALEDALGPKGTLVMPTHSGELSDPANWHHPPVPESWWEPIRQSMPAFQPDLSPTRGMGTVPETFRRQAGTLRSFHPQVSFAARGPQANFITAGHSLAMGLGERSPLGRLYELGAQVLLLGVGHGNNTSLHLAEYRADWPGKKNVRNGMPWEEGGSRQWRVVDEINYDDGDFEALGADFDATGGVREGPVGNGRARLMDQRALVDYAVPWMTLHRTLKA